MKRFVFFASDSMAAFERFCGCGRKSAVTPKKTDINTLHLAVSRRRPIGEEQPILWQYSERNGQRSLPLSEYILFNNRFTRTMTRISRIGAALFNQTEIYALLNGPL